MHLMRAKGPSLFLPMWGRLREKRIKEGGEKQGFRGKLSRQTETRKAFSLQINVCESLKLGNLLLLFIRAGEYQATDRFAKMWVNEPHFPVLFYPVCRHNCAIYDVLSCILQLKGLST